jgi:hypothetical protein
MVGVAAIVVGILLLGGYDPQDYRTENPYWASSTEEAAGIMKMNEMLERKRDQHLIAIAVTLVLGPLMVLNGWWRWSRRLHREREPWSKAKGAAYLYHADRQSPDADEVGIYDGDDDADFDLDD